MEEFLSAYGGPIEGTGKYHVEIEQGKGRDQEVCLIYVAEVQRPYPFSIHHQGSRQYHANQQYNCQCCKIPLQRNPPLKAKFFITPYCAVRHFGQIRPEIG